MSRSHATKLQELIGCTYGIWLKFLSIPYFIVIIINYKIKVTIMEIEY